MTKGPFEPKRLRLSRQFLGFALQELGERVGVSRQAIHQFESGQRTPTEEMIDALAAALLVKPAFFFSSSFAEVEHADCNFRKLEKTTVRDVEQVIAHGALLKELIGLLEEVIEFPTPNFPRCRVDGLGDVELVAGTVRRHWGLTDNEPIVSTMRVAETAGAIVVQFPGVSAEIDALSICGERPMIVRPSDKPSTSRLRFDLAHELGHLIMHQDGARPDDHDAAEEQAHRFASAFLLPKKAFMREFPRGRRLDWTAIFSIKRRWKVSAAAILRRAKDLDIIDAAQYRSGNIFLSKQGYKRNEPFEPADRERPELLPNALLAVESVKCIRLHDVAEQLKVEPVTLGRLIGIEIPELRDADRRVVVSLNERMHWSQVDWNWG